MHKKVKVLLISDKKRWAYASIAESIIKFNDNPRLKLSHISCKKNIDKIKRSRKKYDFFFVLGWQNAAALSFLDKNRTLVGVHSHQSFDHRRTTPSRDISLSKQDANYLNGFLAVNSVSQRLCSVLKKSGVQNQYTPNGVDTSVFKPMIRKGHFTASCVAAAKNDWNKGVNDIIAPACHKSEVELINSSQNKVRNQSMPSFYNRSHVYICASKSEGMPMAVLEAAACGCVIISTRCGDVVSLVNDGENGFLIKRSTSALQNKLDILKKSNVLSRMSIRIREEIVKNWTWQKNVPKWTKFISDSVERSDV